MVTIETVYVGLLRTKALHVLSGMEIITDAPPDNQGKGEAFSPTDLLAASLGSCMLTIMGIAARDHNFDMDGTTVAITKVMGTNPRRVIEIRVDLKFPHPDYTDQQKRIIEYSAHNCPVAKSLHSDILQKVTFNF